ncbi:MAG: GIY-YIG nuclease family protein [bacterium]
MNKTWYVYILLCSDNSYYTGRTSELIRRLQEHKRGIGSEYTRIRRPVNLLWYDVFPNEFQAHCAERQIKGWIRAKKEALMKNDFELLIKLSRSRSSKDV